MRADVTRGGRTRPESGPGPEPTDPVDDILAHHGIAGPWTPLTATGVANRIYATRDVVLRVATDHPDAVPDARTESVAAPIARAAGLPVPELLAFDDSRRLTDRPYSLWERIHGETLGVFSPDPRAVPGVWREVGHWLASLHTGVEACPDPNDWLDRPERITGLPSLIDDLLSRKLLTAADAVEMKGWIDALRSRLDAATPRRFLHYDIHPMNLMCDKEVRLLAILDWGDAGWGDPALEFGQPPLEAVPNLLEGYRQEAPELLGVEVEAGIAWDQLVSLLEDWEARPEHRLALAELRRYGASAGCWSRTGKSGRQPRVPEGP